MLCHANESKAGVADILKRASRHSYHIAFHHQRGCPCPTQCVRVQQEACKVARSDCGRGSCFLRRADSTTQLIILLVDSSDSQAPGASTAMSTISSSRGWLSIGIILVVF